MSRYSCVFRKFILIPVGLVIALTSPGIPDDAIQISQLPTGASLVKSRTGYLKRRFPITLSGNSENPVHIYFPAIGDHDKVTVVPGLHPVIVFAHGYQLSHLNYHYIWQNLVNQGYILVFPDRWSRNLQINIDDYAREISLTVQNVLQLNSNSDSMFYQHLDGRFVLMGHSTGGGASMLAAMHLPDKGHKPSAIVSLAPLGNAFLAVNGTSPVSVADQIDVPLLIIAGSRDCICPPSNHALALYNKLFNLTPKAYVSLQQQTHCDFIDQEGIDSILCNMIESVFCLSAFEKPAFGTDAQSKLTITLVIDWLNYALDRDPATWQGFLSTLDNPACQFSVNRGIAP